MKWKNLKLFCVSAVTFAVTILFCGVLLAADTVFEPTDTKAEKDSSLTKDYDFVKDITSVNARNIRFLTGPAAEHDGVEIGDACLLLVVYQHTGKELKLPETINFIIFDHGKETKKIGEVFFRSGDNTQQITGNSTFMEMGAVSVSVTKVLVPIDTFLMFCESDDLYFKFDSQPRAFQITPPFMERLKDLKATFPAK